MPGTSSPPVAAASDHVTGGAAGQLGQVGLGHLGQVQLQLGGQLGEVPEHIPELQAQVVAHSGIDHTAAVAHHFLDLVGHLAGLPTEAEGRIGGVAAHVGVAGGLAGALLVGAKVHGETVGIRSGW